MWCYAAARSARFLTLDPERQPRLPESRTSTTTQRYYEPTVSSDSNQALGLLASCECAEVAQCIPFTCLRPGGSFAPVPCACNIGSHYQFTSGSLADLRRRHSGTCAYSLANVVTPVLLVGRPATWRPLLRQLLSQCLVSGITLPLVAVLYCLQAVQHAGNEMSETHMS